MPTLFELAQELVALRHNERLHGKRVGVTMRTIDDSLVVTISNELTIVKRFVGSDYENVVAGVLDFLVSLANEEAA